MPRRKWFDEWFDTIYYHILYKNRDHLEAAAFLDAITLKYRIPPASKILDVACGKGRHAIYLNKKGFDVTGVDLSANNIEFADQHSNETLKFEIHDMRDIYSEGAFDYIFNLFTSFGYFETKKENLDVIQATMASLRSGGRFILDFLNPYVVVNQLVESEEKIIDDIKFKIEREYTSDDHLLKKISIEDEGEHFEYYEKVKAIRRVEFLNYFEENSFKVLNVFGDYRLSPYLREKSDRLIFVIEKP
jgi:SAM-dependent methyltransferase